jgi:hypothetical protein
MVPWHWKRLNTGLFHTILVQSLRSSSEILVRTLSTLDLNELPFRDLYSLFTCLFFINTKLRLIWLQLSPPATIRGTHANRRRCPLACSQEQVMDRPTGRPRASCSQGACRSHCIQPHPVSPFSSAVQERTCGRILIPLLAFNFSISSNFLFLSRPRPYPPRSPPFLITLWQGMISGT